MIVFIENIGTIRFKKPIEITIEFDEENRDWAVGSEEYDIWGFGESEETARIGFERELLIELLEECKKRLR